MGVRSKFAQHASSDLVQVLEALYAVEQPRQQWFQGVLESASAALDRGAGVGLVLYDVSGAAPRIDAIGGVDLTVSKLELGTEFHQTQAFAAAIVQCYRTEVCATMPEHVREPWMLRTMRERYAEVGLRDQIMINGGNHSGLGCALYVFSRTDLRLSTPERELMTRIAAHLAAAYRLQRRLAPDETRSEPQVDAILTVDGRLEHAEPSAISSESRLSLKGAVQQREWTRKANRRNDPQKATAAWKPLVQTQWSLVDRCERDGRRYIVAHQNAPRATGLAAFSPREREVVSLLSLGHSNKLIAYELDLAHSTVRVLLARAAAKLGVRTRKELVALLRTQPEARRSGSKVT